MVIVKLPVPGPLGLALTEYMPFCCRVCVPIEALLLKQNAGVRVVPSGLRIVVFTPREKTHAPNVPFVMLKLTVCPDVPLKFIVAFCPGVPMVTLRGVPGVKVPVASGGTL